jgi:hypothetical protein
MRIPVAPAALLTCFIVAAVSVAADKSASGEATVTLKRLLEKRELALEKTPFSGWDNGVELYLHVDGAGVKDARKYKLKVTEAKDDTGTDLKKAPKGVPNFEGEQYQEARPPQTFDFGDDAKKPKPTGFDVEVRLHTPPARSAKTISVRGEMQVLAGGEKKVVRTRDLKKMVGKTVDDPALKAVGVTITVLDPAKPSLDAVIFGGGKGGKSVPLQLAGSLDAIAELRFVDDKGKSINEGSMSRSDQPADKKTITYELSNPLDEGTTLEVEVWPGQKAVKVPFGLQDVKLP